MLRIILAKGGIGGSPLSFPAFAKVKGEERGRGGKTRIDICI